MRDNVTGFAKGVGESVEIAHFIPNPTLTFSQETLTSGTKVPALLEETEAVATLPVYDPTAAMGFFPPRVSWEFGKGTENSFKESKLPPLLGRMNDYSSC
ncbi:UNVERIFIED_CONTAM: hypothetical protein K2H54_022243 [Gekko kuhli]